MRTWVVRSLLSAAALAALVLSHSPAHAAEVRLGVGADYWFQHRGLFALTAAVETHLTRRISLGGRFGGLVTSTPNELGVPVDLQLRVDIDRLYLEGMAGPWILFTNHPFRFHGAFGFGLQTGDVTAGVELGWLDPSPIAGLRVALRI